MAKTTFVGHPMHTILHPVPSALLPFSLVLDILYHRTGDESYARAAYYTMLGGSIGGFAAALAGAGDFAAIPGNNPSRRDASLHVALELGVLGLYSINLLLRRGRRPSAGTTQLLLSVVGTALLLTADWYGAQLIYEYGLRVKGISPVAGVHSCRLFEE